MSDHDDAPGGAATAEATTVGNYFVSNYPPYGFWRTDLAPAALAALERPPRPETDLGLYLHIPFCRKRCHFCYFRVYTDKKRDDIELYLARLGEEHAAHARRAAIAGRRPRFVYVGGGTPSFLSAEQIEALARRLQADLPWDGVEEVTFECEPGTVTARKLAAIRAIGVTRLSLGIENFADRILELNNRAHRADHAERAYAEVRAAGFPQVNIDLIAGMVGETEDNWRDCVARTIALAPDSVTIYQMEVPYNTTIAREMKTAGLDSAPVADWATKRRWVAEAFAALEGAGYAVGSAYTAVRDPARTRFVYRDALWRGADLLGLGVSAFGHVNGVHYQNEHDLAPWLARVAKGEAPLLRAYVPDADERLVREFILQLKLGSLDLDWFQARHGVDPATRFAPQLAALEATGQARSEGRIVRLERDALLQVDRLLHAFFRPEHRGGRYA